MFKVLYFVLILFVIIYFTSEVKMQGSLYKAEDNVFSLQFPKPQWREKPFFYIHCQPNKETGDTECRTTKEANDGNEKLEHFEGW